MDQVFDTAVVAAPERLDAFKAAFLGQTADAHVTLDPDPDARAEEAHGHIEAQDLGGSAGAVRYRTTGHTLTRTPKHVRGSAPERICLALTSPGRWEWNQHGVELQVDSAHAELVLNDFTAPFSCARHGSSTSDMYLVDLDELALPVDTVRKSMYRLRASPVHDAVVRHLSSLTHDVDALGEDAVPHLRSTTLHLVRALLTTAADDSRTAPAAMEDALLPRVMLYLERHLPDPELTPARIAAAHHVSLRRLYQVWAANPVGLGEWILAQRLELAARELNRPGPPLPISVVARRCGFTDAGHFSRRFRARHGCSPREWRLLHG